MAIQVQIFTELRLIASETMHHNLIKLIAVTAQDGKKIIVRIPLMQKQRQAGINGDLDLTFEGRTLGFAW